MGLWHPKDQELLGQQLTNDSIVIDVAAKRHKASESFKDFVWFHETAKSD